MRAFVAIDPDEDACDALEAVQTGLPSARRTPRDNLHLTLLFLGDQPQHLLHALDDDLTAIRAQPFTIVLQGLGVMGDHALHAQAVLSPQLDALHTAVARAARAAGIVPERRRFRPHVTLARLRDPDDPRLAPWLTRQAGFAARMRVTGFSLFRSDLRPDGARHTELAHYPLG